MAEQEVFTGPGAWLKNYRQQCDIGRLMNDTAPKEGEPKSAFTGPEFEFDN